jgi:hypothetical protein
VKAAFASEYFVKKIGVVTLSQVVTVTTDKFVSKIKKSPVGVPLLVSQNSGVNKEGELYRERPPSVLLATKRSIVTMLR